jgi:hypothetical protein
MPPLAIVAAGRAKRRDRRARRPAVAPARTISSGSAHSRRGHAVIMGRRTWESLPGPLADRQNIVVTSHASYVAPGARIVPGLDEALAAVDLPAPGVLHRRRGALPRRAVRARRRCT